MVCTSSIVQWDFPCKNLVAHRVGFVFGTFAAMVHTLIVTGIQFNLFQFVPLALSLNPFRTSLAIMPYSLTMPIVLVAVVKYLSLGNRITPKYIVCSRVVSFTEIKMKMD